MMSTKQFSVLIVDDEPPLREMLRACLRSCGFAVKAARSAEEAIKVINERTIDLALLATNMPGGNGLEFCRHLRAQEHPIGIVLVLAQDAEKDMIAALGDYRTIGRLSLHSSQPIRAIGANGEGDGN